MPKYLLAYHGGHMPETEEENKRIMEAWMGWFGKVGPGLTDPGQPIGRAQTVATTGAVSDGGGPNPVSGWSILTADSFEQAVELARECPVLSGGATIEVAEAMDIPGM